MSFRRVALAGAIFGFAAIAGGIIAAAGADDSTGSPAAAVFSSARLRVFELTETATLPKVDGTEAIVDLVGEAPFHLAAQFENATAWIAELADGSVCVVARDPDGFAATCGDMRQVAAGQVVIRVQNRASEPTLFVGVASNDVTGASVGSRVAALENNVWIVWAGPSDDTYTVSGGSNSVKIDMNADVVPEALPAP